MEEKISDLSADLQDMNPTDFLQQCQQVYTIVFREVCRHVSMQNPDRGRLLVSLWNYNIQLNEKAAELTTITHQEEMKKYKEEMAAYITRCMM